MVCGMTTWVGVSTQSLHLWLLLALSVSPCVWVHCFGGWGTGHTHDRSLQVHAPQCAAYLNVKGLQLGAMVKQDTLCVAKNVMRNVSVHHEVDVVTSLKWHGSHAMCKEDMHFAYLSCAQQCRRSVLLHGVYVGGCVSFCVHGL